MVTQHKSKRQVLRGRKWSISSYIFQKLWYLLALSSHCPYHLHLEVIRVNVRAKLKLYTHNQVVQMPHAPKTRVLTPHATQLRSITSSCHCKCMWITENRKRGTPRPEVWFAHTKTARQTDSGHLSISLLLCR